MCPVPHGMYTYGASGIVSLAVCHTALQMSASHVSDNLFSPEEMAEDAAIQAGEQQARQDRKHQLSSKGWSGTDLYDGAQPIKLLAEGVPGLEDQFFYPVQADTPRFSSRQLLAGDVGKSNQYVVAQYSSVVAKYFIVASAANAEYHSPAHSRLAKELLSFGKQLIAEGDPAVAAVDKRLASFAGPSAGRDKFCAVHGWCSHTLPDCRVIATVQRHTRSELDRGFRVASMLKWAHPLAVITPIAPPRKQATAAAAQQQSNVPAMNAPAPAVHAALASKRKAVPSVLAPHSKQQKAVSSGHRGHVPAVRPVVVAPSVVPAAPVAAASFAAAPVTAVSVPPAGSLQQAINAEGVPGQMVGLTELMFRQSAALSDRIVSDKEAQVQQLQAQVHALNKKLQVITDSMNRYRSERDNALVANEGLQQQLEKLSAEEAYYRQQL